LIREQPHAENDAFGEAQSRYHTRHTLCANMTETSSPPSIPGEGGERIHIRCSNRILSSCRLNRRSWRRRAGPHPQPGGSGETQAPPVHSRVPALDRGPGRGLSRRRRHRRPAASREALFVSSDGLAEAEGARRTGCLGPQKRGRKSTATQLADESQRLRKENARLRPSHPCGRGYLSLLRPHDVPHPPAGQRGPRVPRSSPPSQLTAVLR